MRAPLVDPATRRQILEYIAATTLRAPSAPPRSKEEAELEQRRRLADAEVVFARLSVADLQLVEMNMRAAQSTAHSFDYDPYEAHR